MDFTPQKLTGIYLMPANDEVTYLRFCFSGSLKDYQQQPKPLDSELNVLEAKWYSLDEIIALKNEHRAVVVQKSIDDFLAGCEFPLSALTAFNNEGSLINI
jgi:hypothetical protein